MGYDAHTEVAGLTRLLLQHSLTDDAINGILTGFMSALEDYDTSDQMVIEFGHIPPVLAAIYQAFPASAGYDYSNALEHARPTDPHWRDKTLEQLLD